MKQIELFAGIGGFGLAGEWAGIETVCQVEIDPFCQRVLEKNFPHAHRHTDIKTFNGRPYRGAVDIISGGFPCQPYSHAGKRKGNDDDRALWPQMLRVICEVGPRWVVGENVAGLLSMDGGRVFDGIVTDLENAGYTVETYLIPAVGVGAPHKRDRLWIIAHNDSIHSNDAGSCAGEIPLFQAPEICGCYSAHANLQRCRECSTTKESGSSGFGPWRVDSTPADAECIRWNRRPPAQRGIIFGSWADGERKSTSEFAGTTFTTSDTRCQPRKVGRLWPEPEEYAGKANEPAHSDGRQTWAEHWLPVATRLCRMDDGLSRGLDKGKRLKALGNSIVPQVAYQIFKAIKSTHQ